MTPLDLIAEQYPDAILLGSGEEAVAFGTAIIGVSTDDRIVYSRDKIIEVLIGMDDEPDEEGYDKHTRAVEHFDYNIVRSLPYIENGPIIVQLVDTEK